MKSFSRVFAAFAICLLALLASSTPLTTAARAHRTLVHTLHATVHVGRGFCDGDEDEGEDRAVLSVHICHLARLLNDTDGFIDVSATYKCSGVALGKVLLTVNQTAQQSGNGHATTASGTQDVNCDGLPHKVGIPSFPVPASPGFNLGPAIATVTLTAPSGATVSDTEWIQIIA
jgi:hypothetical protein